MTSVSWTAPPVRRPGLPRAHYLSVVMQQPLSAALPNGDDLSACVLAVAQHGDRQAFAALFKHFAPRVKSYLVRLGSTDSAAEELAQETLISVWRKAPLFDPQQAAVSTWVFTIARNLRVDDYRRRQHVTEDAAEGEEEAVPDTAPGPDEQTFVAQREDRVRRAMAQLSEEQACIVRLSFFEEQPHARIAEQLGLPLGTVKSRVRLAVGHLRRLLEGLES